jgi:hypothetical protein
MQNPDYLPYRPKKRRLGLTLVIAFLVLAALGLALYQIPRINRAVSWRMDIALTYARSLLRPAGKLPTPAVNVQSGAAMIRQLLRLPPKRLSLHQRRYTPT